MVFGNGLNIEKPSGVARLPFSPNCGYWEPSWMTDSMSEFHTISGFELERFMRWVGPKVMRASCHRRKPIVPGSD